MPQRETRANCERYKELRRKANRICKKKKKEIMRKQLEEVNKFKDQNEGRKIYKAIDNLRKGFQLRSNGCRNKNGEIIRDEGKVLQ
jgi:ADP-ribosylglycohydrolase